MRNRIVKIIREMGRRRGGWELFHGRRVSVSKMKVVKTDVTTVDSAV